MSLKVRTNFKSEFLTSQQRIMVILTYVQKWVGFEFIWNIKFNNKYLNCVKIVTCIWNTAFKIHVSNLIAIDFLFLINSQLTTNAQKVLPLNQCKYGNVWSWQSCTFKCLGETAYVLTGINIGLIKCLLFSSGAEYTGLFRRPYR